MLSISRVYVMLSDQCFGWMGCADLPMYTAVWLLDKNGYLLFCFGFVSIYCGRSFLLNDGLVEDFCAWCLLCL